MTPDIREKAERLIDAMCLTWRHDFWLLVPEDNGGLAIRTPLSSGMTEREREALRRDMRQLYEHHIGPALLEAHNAGRAEAAEWLETRAMQAVSAANAVANGEAKGSAISYWNEADAFVNAATAIRSIT